MSAPDDDVVIAFLVHGTFAPHAQWTERNSKLCGAIEKAADKACFHTIFQPIEWSGKNSSADRLEAAKNLLDNFRTAGAEYPNAPILFVGHSHGGSVIAHFLQSLERSEVPGDRELKKRVSGAAFLSTPFIASRMRPYWRDLVDALAYVLSILVFFGVVVAAAIVRAQFLDWPGWMWLPILAVALFVFADPFRRMVLRRGEALEGRLTPNIALRETVGLSDDGNKFIFLRATGDEAAGALVVGQVAIWAIGRLNLAAIGAAVGAGKRWTRLWYSKAWPLVLIIIALYAYWIIGVLTQISAVPAGLAKGFCNSFKFVFLHPLVSTGSALLDTVAAGVLSLVFAPLTAFVIAFTLLLFLGGLLCLAGLHAAGWGGIMEGLFTEIAIEPVPLGQPRLHHVNWTVSDSSPSMRHSYTYTSQDALDLIGEWVREKLKPPAEIEPGPPPTRN